MQGSALNKESLYQRYPMLHGCLSTLFLMLSVLAIEARAAVHTLSANDQGWYNSTGLHVVTNTNTITGLLGATEYRGWFKFTLPAECKDGVQSAQFRLRSVFQSRGNGTTPHNLAVNDVSSANIGNLGVSTNSVPLYTDLGNGVIGNFSVAGNGDFDETITLNAAALAAMEIAAANATPSYGVGIQRLASTSTVYVMGFSNNAFVSGSLTIDCAPDATLTLNKTLVNDHGGTAVITDFTPSIDGTATTWGASVKVAPGNYLASESGLPGYSAGDWGGDCNADGTISIASGQDAVCSIENNDQPAQLTLSKTVKNTNGGSAIASDFTPLISGVATSWSVANQLAAGNYVVSESSLSGYEAGPWQGDCDTDGSITLSLGQSANCEITNRDLGINLEIIKSVDDTSPSIGDILTFTLSTTNSGPDTATNVNVVDILPAGFMYQAGSIAGGDTRADGDPMGVGLQWTINSLPVGVTEMLQFSASVVAP